MNDSILDVGALEIVDGGVQDDAAMVDDHHAVGVAVQRNADVGAVLLDQLLHRPGRGHLLLGRILIRLRLG